MKIIEKLSNLIEEEICDADKYAKLAVEYKEKDPKLADTFYSLSGEELKHCNMLHEQVVRIIGDYRREHGDPPAAMQAVYEYLHKKQIGKVTDVKVIQSHYRE